MANQNFVGAVTYGAGAIGSREPRTANSFLPEFERELGDHPDRLPVEEFARRLSDFFNRQWQAAPQPGEMTYLVAGYNEHEAYGRVYQVVVPTRPEPIEQNPSGNFGMTYGGLNSIVARILDGIDPPSLQLISERFRLTDSASPELLAAIRVQSSLRIPYQFLPLQDCVDLSILLIQTTAQLMKYITDVRGVGGPIDVATITRVEGFRPVQRKQIHGQSYEAGGIP